MNYFSHALRVLLKNKYYTLINVFGLAIGLTVGIIILLYVESDLTYDEHHEKHDQIYRIESQFRIQGKEDTYALSPISLAEMMKAEFPEILNYTRFRQMGRQLFRVDNKQIYQDGLFYADPTVFDLFTHEFLRGNPETALKERNSIVLTASTADKLFGDSDPLGQILKTDNTGFSVTGIIKDLPDNVHLNFEGLVSMTGQMELNESQKIRRLWNVQLYSYLLLPPNYDASILDQKFTAFYEKYMAPMATQLNMENSHFKPNFVPLNEIHFNSKVLYDLPSGNKIYTRAFTAIGILILMLASINYMNLATARSANRTKEIGIRKVLGTDNFWLRVQFMFESLIISFISFMVAILMVKLLLSNGFLTDTIGKDLSLNLNENWYLILISFFISLVLGLFSGLYPAFYLSSISVLKALKGSVKSGPKSLFLRKILVSFQFFISIGVVLSTLLMTDQIEFLRNKELGFTTDHMVIIQTNDTTNRNRMDITKAELLQNPNIIGVTSAIGINGQGNIGGNLLGAGRRVLQIEMEDSTMTQDTYNMLNVGEGFIEAMGMEIIAGRDFNEDMPTDLSNGIIVNETIVKSLGWSNPIGKVVSLMNVRKPTRVIGVVKDFNAHSLHQKIEPTTISRFQIPKNNRFARPSFIIHTREGRLKESLEYLENKFTELDPNHPFEYQLLDQKAESLYRTDQRQSRLLGNLSIICIIISCIGLLGLSSYTTSLRIKEIGVRKVLGATISELVLLLFKDIIVLVVIGFLVAIPLVYLFINNWLSAFAYQMAIENVFFLTSIITISGALVISFLTISFHSIKAARNNPIHALNSDA